MGYKGNNSSNYRGPDRKRISQERGADLKSFYDEKDKFSNSFSKDICTRITNFLKSNTDLFIVRRLVDKHYNDIMKILQENGVDISTLPQEILIETIICKIKQSIFFEELREELQKRRDEYRGRIEGIKKTENKAH